MRKARNIFTRLILLMVLLNLNCIEQIPLETGSSAPKLVVDGLITDEPGPHQVALYYTNPDLLNLRNPPVLNARVTIKDDLGQEEALMEVGAGVYQTRADFAGQPGQTYTLYIETEEGQQYASFPEYMPINSPIDSIYDHPRVETEYLGNVTTQQVGYVDVFIDIDDNPSSSEYFRYETEKVEVIITSAPDGQMLLCCFKCYWPRAGQDVISLASDQFSNGNQIRRIKVETIENDISTDMLVRIRQYALNASAHEFWQQIKEQRESIGSIFDPPPANIKGNIYNVNDRSETIFGYFGASPVTRTHFIVQRRLYEAPGRTPVGALQGDCRELLLPGITEVPPPEFR
ncbi:MAG: DUF4249 domain-containing protein [Candidatus Cyclobacteriaceae bacterium M3_2C_046]